MGLKATAPYRYYKGTPMEEGPGGPLLKTFGAAARSTIKTGRTKSGLSFANQPVEIEREGPELGYLSATA